MWVARRLVVHGWRCGSLGGDDSCRLWSVMTLGVEGRWQSCCAPQGTVLRYQITSVGIRAECRSYLLSIKNETQDQAKGRSKGRSQVKCPIHVGELEPGGPP